MAALVLPLVAAAVLIPRLVRTDGGPSARHTVATNSDVTVAHGLSVDAIDPSVKPSTLIASTAHLHVETIAADPTILSRYATEPLPDTVERINDAELFKELAAANVQGGLMTIGDRTQLVLAEP